MEKDKVPESARLEIFKVKVVFLWLLKSRQAWNQIAVDVIFSLTSLIKCSFVSSHCKQTRYLLPFVSLTMWLLKESFVFNYTSVKSNQAGIRIRNITILQYITTNLNCLCVFFFFTKRELTILMRITVCPPCKTSQMRKSTESEKRHSRKAKTAKLQLIVNVLHYNKWLHYNKVVFNHPLCFNEYNCGTICWSVLK